MTFCWYFANLKIKFLPCFRFYSSYLILTDVWLTVFALVSFFNLGQFKQICYQFFQHYFNLLIFFKFFLILVVFWRFVVGFCQFYSILSIAFLSSKYVLSDVMSRLKSFCQTCWVGKIIWSDLIGLIKYFIRINYSVSLQKLRMDYR